MDLPSQSFLRGRSTSLTDGGVGMKYRRSQCFILGQIPEKNGRARIEIIVHIVLQCKVDRVVSREEQPTLISEEKENKKE